MNHEAKFNQKLAQLIQEVSKLPEEQRRKLEPLLKETIERHAVLGRSADKIISSLGDLRLYFKYLIFDLEATRRELKNVRSILDEKKSQDDEDDGPHRARGSM